MKLKTVVAALEDLAPLGFAEEWDNVGLLVEPPGFWSGGEVSAVLLAIDLTEAVLDEALEAGVDLVVAYHPPVFSGLKRLTSQAPLERVVLRCVAEGVAVYAPHTALDAAVGGLAEWLLQALGPTEGVPLVPHPDAPNVGAGRAATLSTPTALGELVSRVKAHLSLAQVRVAGGDPDRLIERVAVCPGAGGALFADDEDADLYLTGEMRHHDVLAKVARGASVILTDHTNTERGYLPVFAERLSARLPDVEIVVSIVDRDPLQIS